jgi:hypothetical protein
MQQRRSVSSSQLFSASGERMGRRAVDDPFRLQKETLKVGDWTNWEEDVDH